ncbi:MAG: hypothetical protein ACXVRH_03140 [Thermoleophilaceae bacterium]
MLRKIFIAVVAGALLSPVGYAASKTGGKGFVPRGGTYCSQKARAAGGSHPSCVVTKTSTVTKYTTVRRGVTTTRYVDHTTTSTKRVTYTQTATGGGGEVVVTEHVLTTATQPGKTSTETITGLTSTVVTGDPTTVTDTETDTTTTTETTTVTTTTLVLPF